MCFVRFCNVRDAFATAKYPKIPLQPAAGEVFAPENAEIHEEAYQRFRRLYPRLAGW